MKLPSVSARRYGVNAGIPNRPFSVSIMQVFLLETADFCEAETLDVFLDLMKHPVDARLVDGHHGESQD